MRRINQVVLIIGLIFLIAGCSPDSASDSVAALPTLEQTPAVILQQTQASGYSQDELTTLSSLERVTEYPLYTMRYHGAYRKDGHALEKRQPDISLTASWPLWGCSLFATLGDGKDMFYGRNFDWRYSPALLLFTDPSQGYASVSMVDIDYLVPLNLRNKITDLTDLPVEERQFLLDAPAWPFDGINDQGLVVGMAAVMDSRVPRDPRKPTIGSLEVIRQMLDYARNVDEALAILETYNIDMGSVPIHYLIADRSGRSALVEFYDEMIVIPNKTPWHLATNHLRANVRQGDPSGCWRYDLIEQLLTVEGGDLTSQQAVGLLQSVSQEGEFPTQWSILYGIDSGLIQIVMGREFNHLVSFRLDLAD